MPFLARQRARLVLSECMLASDENLPKATEGPSFLIRLESQGDLWAALSFDGAAILALVEGLFGGATSDADDVGESSDGGEAPDSRQSLGETLTLAQRAMLRRLCRDLSGPFERIIQEQTGQKLNVKEALPLKRDEFPDLPADALTVDCRVEGVAHPWTVRVFIGVDALQKLTAQDSANNNEVSAGPTMAMAAARIPVTVIAELGRVTLRLSQVLALRVGDTLRLPSAANDPVLVRVEGVPKFDAVPVISRGQVAVKIQCRHSE